MELHDLEGTQYCGGTADIVKCFDQVNRELVVDLARKAGMPERVWRAYEMYQKAGDSQRMASAKAQFPSIEEIFNENMKEGESLTVGCWINETVKLERRPAN